MYVCVYACVYLCECVTMYTDTLKYFPVLSTEGVGEVQHQQ